MAERRWNLRLTNGLDVRLPEAGVEQALERLVALDREKKLLSRDITSVDLRLPDRVTVPLVGCGGAGARRRAQGQERRKKEATRELPPLRPDAEDEADPAAAQRAGRGARCRLEQDRLPDRAACARIAPQQVLTRRTHAVEVVGYGHAAARGTKAGGVVDLAQAEDAIRQAVDCAERMA